MYLVELDPKTGLVRVDGEYDGVRAIKEFREVINAPDLGVECFTAIALTADYLTPIGYYTEKDRPYKAMEKATGGNRRAFPWANERIQLALKQYNQLQYNPTIEEKRTLDFMLLEKLKEIKDQKSRMENFHPIPLATPENIHEVLDMNKDAEKLLGDISWENLKGKEQKSLIRKINERVIKPYNFQLQDKKAERDEEKMMKLFKQLDTIKGLIKAFNDQHQNEDVYSEGVVRNGYKLSRLEEKQMDKNSFYHHATE